MYCWCFKMLKGVGLIFLVMQDRRGEGRRGVYTLSECTKKPMILMVFIC